MAGGGDEGVMARHGFYDRHSRTQGGAAGLGLPELAAAVEGLALERGTVRIADLGCAQGHNSLGPLRAAVAQLRARTAAPIEVVHTDLPGNDWATLFDVVEHDPASYLAHAEDVYPGAVGRSFYEPLFAPGSLELAWCSSALHWLSRSPGPIDDHFFVQSSTDHPARDRYRSQSARDWERFLGHRATELVVGGAVVVVDVVMGDDARMGSEALFDRLQEALRAAADAGAVTATEHAAFAYPTWFRTLAELRAPFHDGATTAPGPSGARLALVDLEPVELADPFLDAYRSSGDAAAYGRAQAGFLEGFLRPSFRTALAGRTDDEAEAILDDVFADAARRISTDVEAVSPTYRLVVGRIVRSS